MKKLMIGLAAAGLCSAVFADVTSANVVGYKANELRQGLKTIVPCFVEIDATGDEGADIYSLAPTGLGATSTDEITIQVQDAYGRKVELYGYRKPKRGDTGWYNLDTNKILAQGEKVFDVGEAFVVTAADGLGLTGSGAVDTADRTIPLRQGLLKFGNFTAKAIDIYELIPGGLGATSTDEITIQVQDAYGRKTELYGYRKPKRGDTGWYNLDTNVIVTEGTKFFQPGEGFTVTAKDGLSLTIKGVTL